jgi:hypothetical protein
VAQKTQSELAVLQQSQSENARLHSKLGLGYLNFSTPGEVAINLPRRMFELMFRPYPWELSDTNQRLGLIETLFVLLLIVGFTDAIVSRRRSAVARVAPLAYPALLLWIAYSLAVANAGTGFRYRTVIIPLMIGMICALNFGEAESENPATAEPSEGMARPKHERAPLPD